MAFGVTISLVSNDRRLSSWWAYPKPLYPFKPVHRSIDQRARFVRAVKAQVIVLLARPSMVRPEDSALPLLGASDGCSVVLCGACKAPRAVSGQRCRTPSRSESRSEIPLVVERTNLLRIGGWAVGRLSAMPSPRYGVHRRCPPQKWPSGRRDSAD